MRIAHVTATFPPYRGGTGNVCFHNARELARRGHDVHVFTAQTSGTAAHEQRDGITIHRFRPLLRVGNAPLLPELLPALRGFDLIHLHFPFFGGEIAAGAARIQRTPLVVTYHQDVLLSGIMGWVERSLRWTIGRAALRAADQVLFTSRDYGAASYARTLLHGREQHIGELPNGVDTRHFVPAPASPALRARFGLHSSDQIVMLVAGLDRAHYFKGVDVLLASLAKLPANVHAIIVGDGDLRAQYAASATAQGIEARVHFAGRVADRDLPTFYQTVDVAVLPSVTMGEAFGLVLVESLACGTPVVASDLPGVRTVVDHEQDGLLVPPRDPQALANALQQMLSSTTDREAMGAYGRAKVEARYDWAQIAAQLEAVYRDLVALPKYAARVARGAQ